MIILFQKMKSFYHLHDFLGEEKQDEVLLFEDNFGDNSDDLKNVKKCNHTEDTDNDIFIDIVEKDSKKSWTLKSWKFF